MPLREGQWQIGPVVFGKGTKYPISRAAEVTYGAIRTQDGENPRGDEIYFGQDLYGPNLITFAMAVWSQTLADDIAEFNRWWQGNPVRRIPGAAVPLMYCYQGLQKQVFGRPRNFAPAVGPTGDEWINYISDFQCIDNKFYSQVENTYTVSIQPASAGGGFSAPFIAPLVSVSSRSNASTEFVVGGKTDAWVKLVLNGPINNAEIEVFTHWTQKMPSYVLGSGENLEINSRPWERRVRRNGLTPAGGVFDQASRKLSELTIAPGNREMVLRGTDVTNSARVDISWFDTYLTL